CVRLHGLIDADTARRLQREIDASDFIERVHNDAGDPPPVDLCMQNHRVLAWLHFLANDPLLLSLVQQITGCGPLGSFGGVVYRLVPGRGYDAWHDDAQDGRTIAMSVNLSTGTFAGGVLQLRQKGSAHLLHEVANVGLGDATLFRIAPHLEHRVTDLEGTVPRTAFAGWFRPGPDYFSGLKKAFATTSQPQGASA